MKNYIFGKNAVENIIKNFSNKIIEIFILKNYSFDPEIYNIIKNKKIKWKSLEKKDFHNLTKVNSNQQGIIALVKEYEYFDFNILDKNKKNQIVLILDKLQDPQNFGAIIRSASFFNVDAIIIPNKNQVQVTPTVVKASSGTIYDVPIIRVSSLKAAISSLKLMGFWIYSSYLCEKSISICNVEFDNKSAIILGNEGKGIENKIVEISDFIFQIKTTNSIDSLNVSVATGIILFWLNINKK